MRRARIGARHAEDVGVCGSLHGGTDLHARLGARDHLLAARVAAFLRADLVFDHHGGGTGAGILDDRALDVERVAIAGIAVADQRDFRCGAGAVAHAVQHLGERDQPGVRQRETGG
jgi:hypothetical protein